MSRQREMDLWAHEHVLRFKEEGRIRDAEPLDSAVAAMESRVQLVAEGDSWFDYLPGRDLIDCLRVRHGYRIDNFAKAGDTLENMIYGSGITRRFERVEPTITPVLWRIQSVKPKAFLFSGGGNDIAGFFQFAGPRLLPALTRKAVPIADQRHAVDHMINKFNALLASLAAAHKPRFQYVDLRGIIDPETDWANELHLVNSAFAAAAEAIDERIASSPDSAEN